MIEIKFPYWRDAEMNDIDKIHERLAKLEEAVFAPVGLAVLTNGDTASFREGFIAGCNYKEKRNLDELIKDRPRLTRCRDESGEDVLKWVRPSKMENIND